MAARTDKEGFIEGVSRCDLDPRETPSSNSISASVVNTQQTVAARKVKPIPPPLDLSKRGPLCLDEPGQDHYREHPCFSASPRSPASANQKHLPFRKRAFSWTTFHDEGMCNSLSPGPSSAVIQRGTYSSFLPASPHISRLSVIKQESVDHQDDEVFDDYPPPVAQETGSGRTDKPNNRGYSAKTVIHYHTPHNESPAFPTPATPSPISPMNFPSSSTFFPSHFQPKISSYSWSGTLLSPAPSLNSSSQEELAAQCRGSWKYEESDIESPSSFHMASKGEVSRQDYHQEVQSPQAGTSDLCDRLQRFDFVIPSPKAIEKRNNAPTPMAVDDPTVNLPPSPAKRPMNGFMLFAQKYRLQLIQQFPGRDNRAISVMLGDAWKSLNPAEKEIYTAEAHMRAEEYRRLFPDCWKRKRFKSTS